MQYPQHIAVLLAFLTFSGFGLTFLMPGILTFAILKKPEAAAAIIGCVQFGQFLLGGIGIFAGAAVSDAVGNGPMLTGCSVLLILSCFPLAYTAIAGIKRAKENPNAQMMGDMPAIVV